MTVESATYISQLNSANPSGSDAKSEGDDHLRLVKSVLRAQFPNFGAAALNASNTQLDKVVTTIAINASAPSSTLNIDASGNVQVNAGSFTVSGKLQIPKYDTSGGDYIAFVNRGSNAPHLNGYDIGGIFASGYRDVSDPAYIAGITFERGPSNAGASSLGSIVFRTDILGTSTKAACPERARIDPGGNFIQTVNTSGPSLANNQTMSASLPSDTQLRFSVRGSDGITRTATLTLS